MDDGAGSGRVPASKSVHDSILTAIGDTPLVRLPAGFEPGVSCELLLKGEFTNPGGSITDRIALFMVREAERKGLLKPGGRIVESSSGNTGASLCLVAAALGYPVTIVIPDKMSQEKIDVLRACGADVVVTPANVAVDHPDHYTRKAQRIAEETPGAWWANQYHNPDNTEAHYRSTGAEIWRQCEGRLDAFVAGAGTGGSLAGVARYLKEQDPTVQVVGVDPPGSILADYWRTGELVEPGFYFVEGVGEEEVPGAWDPEVIDDYRVVTDADSFAMARRLALATGIFGGGSTGMNLVAALDIARKLPADARVVTLVPDSGRAYLSKVYSEDWLRDLRFLPATPAAGATVADLVRDGARAWVKPGETLFWAARHMGERGVRPLPVLAEEGGELLGVVDEMRVMELLAADEPLEPLLVQDYIAEAGVVLDASAPWTEALAALTEHERVLVREPDGWASLERRDMLRALPRLDHGGATDV